MSAATVTARLQRALVRGAGWRLLLVWVTGMLVPTWVASLPLTHVLSGAFSRSVRAPEIARGFDFMAVSDAMEAFDQSFELLGVTALTTTVLALLLSPFLTGMTLTAARSPVPLGFAALTQGGVREYMRLLRLWLVSLLPLGVAIAIASALSGAASKHGEQATLQSSADSASRWALLAGVLLVGIAHLTAEAGRARFGAEPELRSAFKAWWRGLRVLRQRPLASIVLYLVPTILGGVVAAVLALVRIRMVPASRGPFLLAFVLTQLIVAAIAWGRMSRLLALHDLTRDEALGDAAPRARAREASGAVVAPDAVDAA